MKCIQRTDVIYNCLCVYIYTTAFVSHIYVHVCIVNVLYIDVDWFLLNLSDDGVL